MADIWYDVDTALSEVPVNILPLLDATDFKTIEDAVAYNAAGLALHWHFCTTGGAYTVTAVTPTTGGNYDWTDQGTAGIYTIEIPASGGASINNDTEGFGWFTGVATGVLPWRGPVCGFRAAALNNSMIDGTTIDVNVTAMAVGVVTASAVATDAIDADAIADNAINAGAIASGAITSAKFAAGAIDAAAIADNAIDLATFADDAKALFGVIAYGTMQAGSTGTSAVLAASTSFADDLVIGATLVIRSGTGAGQARVITDWVSATDTATVDTWTTTPDNTSGYVVIATAPASTTSPSAVNVVQISGDATAADNLELACDGTGYNIGGGSVVAASVTGNIGGNVTGSVGSVTGAVGSVTDPVALTSAYDFAKGTAAMTEAYAADGAAMTPAQALHQIWSFLSEKSVAATTLTAKKLDGSTTSMTFTLNDATTPTSITRAS